MIANFLIDSRYGGPHLYLESLKKNIQGKKVTTISKIKNLII